MVYLARFLRFVVGSRLEPVVLPHDSLCNFRATARPAGVTSPLDGCISVPPVEKLILFKVVEGRRVLRADHGDDDRRRDDARLRPGRADHGVLRRGLRRFPAPRNFLE